MSRFRKDMNRVQKRALKRPPQPFTQEEDRLMLQYLLRQKGPIRLLDYNTWKPLQMSTAHNPKGRSRFVLQARFRRVLQWHLPTYLNKTQMKQLYDMATGPERKHIAAWLSIEETANQSASDSSDSVECKVEVQGPDETASQHDQATQIDSAVGRSDAIVDNDPKIKLEVPYEETSQSTDHENQIFETRTVLETRENSSEALLPEDSYPNPLSTPIGEPWMAPMEILRRLPPWAEPYHNSPFPNHVTVNRVERVGVLTAVEMLERSLHDAVTMHTVRYFGEKPSCTLQGCIGLAHYLDLWQELDQYLQLARRFGSLYDGWYLKRVASHISSIFEMPICTRRIQGVDVDKGELYSLLFSRAHAETRERLQHLVLAAAHQRYLNGTASLGPHKVE